MNENLQKYNKVFQSTFNVSESELKNLRLKESDNWNSVGHIFLISTLEDVFYINFEPDDIFALRSYSDGIELLKEKYNIQF